MDSATEHTMGAAQELAQLLDPVPKEVEEQPPLPVGGGTVTTTRFIQMVLARMAAKRVPASVAVDAILSRGLLSDDALFEFARDGAIARVGTADHSIRQGVQAAVRRQGVGRPLRDKVQDVLGRIQMLDAHGLRKPLLNFAAVDWRALRQECSAQIEGFSERKRLAADVLALLKQHRVEFTRDLPADVLAELSDKAAAAWARSRS